MRRLNGQRTGNNSGFTLIEVLIVVVIIGVLAALVIPRVMGQTERAKMAEAFHLLGALHRAEQQYMDLTGATEYLAAAFWVRNPGFTRFGGSGPTHIKMLQIRELCR